MSACLMVAAQMYGREQDRIYHVLVSPEFERNKDFFYPPKKSKLIELKDENGNPFFKETKYAKINLIHIPFVSIRKHLSKFFNKVKDPATLILSLVKEDEKKLIVNLKQRKIIYNGLELNMAPAWMALYAFFAKRKVECKKGSSNCNECVDCFLDIHSILQKEQDKITKIYESITRRKTINKMSDTGIINLSKENFNMYKGKIKMALLRRFGPYALKELEIASVGLKPKRYGIMMDKERIEIISADK